MEQHRKGKVHKRRSVSFDSITRGADSRRLRALRQEPYTQKEAEAAIGLGTNNGPKRQPGLSLLEHQTAALDIEASETG